MSGAIYITIGGGAAFGINETDQLVFHSNLNDQNIEPIPIGLASQKRISDIQSHLERLKIHCPWK